MPIKLPRSMNPYFLGMTACGRIQSDSEAVDRLFTAPSSDIYTEYASNEGPMIFRVFWTKRTNKHLHIDFVKPDAYGGIQEDESTNVPLDTIQVVLESLFGEQIEVNFFGRFRVPLDRLPKQGLVSLVPVKSGSGRLTVSIASCEYKVTGAPFNRIGWKITDDEQVTVEIGVQGGFSLGEDYIIDRYDTVEHAFKSFVKE